MRTNMDEYEDLDEPKEGNSRAMSWMVLAVAVGGFAALAYYAYNSGSKATAEGDMIMVEADGTPIKEVPADPEGEQFMNKDKTIYDVIAPTDGAATGEKLLPEAEQPVTAMSVEDSEDNAPVAVPPAAAAPQAVPSTTTFVAKEEAQEPIAPAAAPVAQTVTEQPVATVAKPVAEKPVVMEKPVVQAPVEKSALNPQIINEKKVVVKKEPAKEAAKAPAKPKAEAAATGGSYKLQLGAFKSEEEAQSAWKKISGKHSNVLSGAPTIVKAEVNSTTFYRLRTGSYASSDAAKAACASMAGQACMAVK
jgi:cell division protein FtsN